jgi:hypothetical protein
MYFEKEHRRRFPRELFTRDEAERFTENGKASSRRRANHGFRARSPKALGMILRP